MKRITVVLVFVIFYLSVFAQGGNHQKLPSHQLGLAFTNAVTGFFKDDFDKHFDVNKDVRYGFIAEINYEVKLTKWFSLGTGLALIHHRAFLSDSIEPSPPLSSNSGIIMIKYYESIYTNGMVDLSQNFVFSIYQLEQFELQITSGISIQTTAYRNESGFHVSDSDHVGTVNYHDAFPGRWGCGFLLGAGFKIGNKSGVLIQPEFRLYLGTPYEYRNEKAYSAGIKLGWFFNLV